MQYMHYNEQKSRGTTAFPIELYHVNKQHPQYHMPLHWHVEVEIVRVLTGTLHLVLNDEHFYVQEGQVIIINSGILHTALPEECIYECLVFNWMMLSRQDHACYPYLEKLNLEDIVVKNQYDKTEQRIYDLICNIFDEMADKRLGYELAVQGGLLQMVGMFFREQELLQTDSHKMNSSKRIKQLKQVLSLIEESYQTDFTLDDLAKVAGMSPKYFCRFFREMTQRTPIDYLNYYRIERACYLLISTDQFVTEIAFACGFNDLSYFIRTFKKYKGVTPKQFLSSTY